MTPARIFVGMEARPHVGTLGEKPLHAALKRWYAEPGDDVILPVPYYFNHDMWLKLDGLRPIYVDTSSTDFVPDPEAVEAAITERTRAIVVVSPGNPTGATVPASTIETTPLALQR